MQSFKMMGQSVREHIASLSANAKLFIGTFFIIVVMVLFLSTLYMGGPSMEALPISLNAESRQRAVQFLATTGLNWQEKEGIIHVPIAQRDHVISLMSEEGIISPDQIDFDSMVRDENLFLTKGQYRTRTRVATQNVLAGMIARMRNIQSATVVISGGDDAVGIGRAFIERTASVTILSKGDEVDQVLVDAIARMVAGATHGLKAESVAVIDARTGRSFYARSHETTSVNSDMGYAAEQDARRILEDLLGYIPGVRISVNAVKNRSRSGLDDSTPMPVPYAASEPAPSPLSARANLLWELGIRANMGMKLPMQQEEPVVPVGPDGGWVEDDVVPSFHVNTSIAVPRAYMMEVYLAKHGPGSIDNDAHDLLVSSTLADVRSQVDALFSGSSFEGSRAGEISVTMFTEVRPPVNTPGQQPTSWVTLLADSHALRTIGLGTLAFLTAAMMFVMLRRAGGHAVNTRYESMGTSGTRGIPLAGVGEDDGRELHLPAAAIEQTGGTAVDPGLPEGCSVTVETAAGPGIEAEVPALIEESATALISFEDLLQLDDEGLKMVFKGVNRSDLAIALKTASDELKARFFSNMPRVIIDAILDEMEAVGPVHLCEVESAQKRILDMAHGLHSPSGSSN